MSLLSAFMKRRIEQMITDADNPAVVIERLYSVMQENDRSERREIENYVLALWKEKFPESSECESFNNNGDPAIHPENEQFEEIDLREVFFEVLEEEEQQSRLNIKSMQFDFDQFAESIELNPVFGDIKIISRYIQKNNFDVLTEKNKIKKNFLKTLLKEIGPNIRHPYSNSLYDKDNSEYVEFLTDLLMKSDLLQAEQGSKQFRFSKKISSFINNQIPAFEILGDLVKTFWLDMLNLGIEKNDKKTWVEFYKTDSEISIMIAETTKNWTRPGDLSFPFFMESWMVQSLYNNASEENSLKLLCEGIADVDEKFFKPFYILGLMEKKNEAAGKYLIRLTSPGKYALKTIASSYTPLIQILARLNASRTLASGLITISKLIPNYSRYQLEEIREFKKLQLIVCDLEISIANLVIQIFNPANDETFINRLLNDTKAILKNVLSVISEFKKKTCYNDEVQKIYCFLNIHEKV